MINDNDKDVFTGLNQSNKESISIANGELIPVLGEVKALLRCIHRDKYRDLIADKVLCIPGLTANLICICCNKERL